MKSGFNMVSYVFQLLLAPDYHSDMSVICPPHCYLLDMSWVVGRQYHFLPPSFSLLWVTCLWPTRPPPGSPFLSLRLSRG